ncbi:CxxH/CxxC protein [Anaerobacillus sp. CMMVII]|uniref:CxxH/CxxC protein n=1 Tax=Anaerobacillus sp. CMMVII TaxID=2755588 RepID=UPI0028E0A3E7|nr:CxxH/CxxC protein [Anaerobacillus sp. CMMVII]
MKEVIEVMYYCCEEHVDLAIDIVVDERELAPIMEKIDPEKKLSTTCNFCTEKAIYQISG